MSDTHILQDALNHIPVHIQSVPDYERVARSFVRDDIWHYIEHGAEQNISLQANRLAFDDLFFVPRMLRDVKHGHTKTDVFGKTWTSPIMLAPVAYHALVHPEAELATIKAAVALQVPMVVSTLASVYFEQISAMAKVTAAELKRPVPPIWLQLYSQATMAETLAVVDAAVDAGFEAIVWTVDAHYKRSGLHLPEGVSAVNIGEQAQYKHTTHLLDETLVFGSWFTDHAPTWADLKTLREHTSLPILVKGLLSVEDAIEAKAMGADGVVVSNHGGRVLDGSVPALKVLASMRAALGEDFAILLDGGVRSGADVVKALALGANAVMVGRPQLHALAVAGTLGVAHMLHLLRMELELCMAQLGCATVKQLDAAIFAKTNPLQSD